MKRDFIKNVCLLAVMTITVLTLNSNGFAADKVVVVPLGGATGNAVTTDVLKGKTFSNSEGKGLTGTLERHPMGQTFTNSIGMTFNLIPAGTFIMGSPDGTGAEPIEPGRLEGLETQHQVTLTSSFYMQTTEVTNKQWDTLIFEARLGVNPSYFTGDNKPVEFVNWFEAAYFANRLSEVEGLSPCYTLIGCNFLVPGKGMECTSVEISRTCTGYRLPTEAQWEYAARAGTATAYANPVSFDSDNMVTDFGFNSNLAAMGWYGWNDINSGYLTGPKPVAQKQANRWGLYDMHGNVTEWCQDWWNGSDYSSDPVVEPQGPATGSHHIIRGGHWVGSARGKRSAARSGNWPDERNTDTGFRLALTPGQ